MQKQLALKIITILIIGLVIIVPVQMVSFKIDERQGYHQQAKYSVAQSWTGEQQVFNPVLIIPYHILTAQTISNASGFQSQVQNVSEKQYYTITPSQLLGAITVANKSVFKGIYEIPIYNSDITYSGTFSQQSLQDALDKVRASTGFQSLGTPYISVHISDVRGVDSQPSLLWADTAFDLKPGSQMPNVNSGLHAELPDTMFDQAGENSIPFKFTLSLRGMGSLSFIPLADNAKVSMSSNWPHPEFIGASLPADRAISNEGFRAEWESTHYSNNSADELRRCIDYRECHNLYASSAGVNFIEPVDVYLQSERSIKYAMLFIGLSFITFFIFEHLKNVRIHPIQYAFVGLAISTFYLLLISLAEHIAFHWAYLIGVGACSSLLLFYVRHVLRNGLAALLFFGMITLLYGVLYVIVQAEDFALLMGSALVFILLSAMMIITRKIDWYAIGGGAGVNSTHNT